MMVTAHLHQAFMFFMKIAYISSLLVISILPVSASVIYTDLQDIAVPNTIDGIYINIITGATATSEPGDFNAAPWINLFLGGRGISNSELLRPWASVAPGSYDPATTGNYFINLAPGSVIDSSGLFVSGESGSEFHLGAAGNQFHSGVAGYLAFEYQSTISSAVSYGWLSFTPNDNGSGISVDLAYSNTPGESLIVAAIPEPAHIAGLAGLLMLGFACVRRRFRAG